MWGGCIQVAVEYSQAGTHELHVLAVVKCTCRKKLVALARRIWPPEGLEPNLREQIQIVGGTRRGHALRAPGGTRTLTVTILSRLPLPIGLRGPAVRPA